MESRRHLYVSRKHPATWLMVLCMVASAVVTVVMTRGMIFTSTGIWCGIVLPCICVVWYALTAVLSGEEMLYKITANLLIVASIFTILKSTQLLGNCRYRCMTGAATEPVSPAPVCFVDFSTLMAYPLTSMHFTELQGNHAKLRIIQADTDLMKIGKTKCVPTWDAFPMY